MSIVARPRRAYKRALVAAVVTASVAVPVIGAQAASAAPGPYIASSAHHVTVQSAWPGAQNYDRRQGPFDRLQTGYTAAIPEVQPANVSRSYFQVSTAPLAGKQILRAWIDTKVVHSYSCTSQSPTQLWHTGAIAPSTSWQAQPALIRQLGATTKNNRAQCPNDGTATFDVTGLISEAAQSGWSDVTLGLRAQNENDPSALRSFRLDPVLFVEYNSAPNVPAELSTDNSGCGAGTFVPTTTPQLRANVSDPDGDVVEVLFRLYDSTGQLLSETPAHAQSGTVAQVQAQNIPAEGKYSWVAQARDGIAASAWTQPCDFTVGEVPLAG